MIISIQQLIALSPILVLILVAIVVMLFISYNRNHFFTFLTAVFGLLSSFLALNIVNKIIPINVTMLFHIDKYSLMYIGIIILSSLFTCIFSYSWLKQCSYNSEEFYLLLLFSTIGCISLVIANHFATFFVSVELISLSSIGLIAYDYLKKISLEAAIKYTILSGVISTFLLFGIALIYSVSGNLDLYSLIYEMIMTKLSLNSHYILLLGFCFFVIGCSFKLSIFPFHIWTPDVYQGTPSEVLMFLSTSAKISIFSILFKIFIILLSFNIEILTIFLSIISCLSILIGNIMTISQISIKRLLGYSSISQLGYLFITLIISNNIQFSLEVVNIYLISYVLTNIGILGVISIFSRLYNNYNLDCLNSYRSLFWEHPILSAIMTIMLLSLSGIPITLGFLGKFYLISFIVKNNLVYFNLVVVIGLLIGLYSYMKIICYLFSTSNALNLTKQKKVSRYNLNQKILIGLLFMIVILILILGIFPQIIIDLVKVFFLEL